uniref:FecR domain-containing protein n=1 Tax=Fischerella thermalis TaxID=372787 RepID=UPI00307E7DAF
MFRKLIPFLVASCLGTAVLPLPEQQATAATPLTRAVIQNLRNLVQLIPHNQPKRRARKSDAIIPGDGLSTGRASLAELRFNDGSLARVGEQAIFRFLPKTRNFRLSNGTVLLLIPPGQGRTRVNTPNAAAAIRGSALFVRYDQKKDTTVVAALTNSGIEVFNKDASQRRELRAGQMLVVVKGQFQGLYDFDLRTFYETSDIVRGLDLPKQEQPSSDPAIAKVQAETAEALASQKPITGQQVIENPSFVKLSPSGSDSPNNPNSDPKPSTNSSQTTGQNGTNTAPQKDNTNQESNTQPTNNTTNSQSNSNNQNTSTQTNTNEQKKVDTPPPVPDSTTPNTTDKPKSQTPPPASDSTGSNDPQPQTPPPASDSTGSNDPQPQTHSNPPTSTGV